MSAMAIGGIVFGCVFAGALFGMYLGAVLPKQYLSEESKDIIRVAMAVIATLAALVVGLLIASAKSSFDTKDSELRRVAANAVVLDRMMAEYGPETREARDLLRQSVLMKLHEIWPEGDAKDVRLETISQGPGPESIQRKLLDLTPQSDAQRWLNRRPCKSAARSR